MSYQRHNQWPTPEKSYNSVIEVIEIAKSEGRLGLDLEYGPSGPTIIGVASLKRCAAWHYSDILGRKALECGVPIAAHAGIGADKPVIERATGLVTPLEQWHDTMIKHYIVNPDLASVPKSITGEDRDDSGVVLGLMNLWACTSLLHDLPNWKECIGSDVCLRERRPCPEHDELSYCAVDSWAGLIDDYALDSEMERLGIPQSYYDFRAQLQSYCDKISKKGVLVSKDIIDSIEAAIQSRKATLFPCRLEWTGKNGKTLKKPRKVWEGPFNPNSPKAVLQWFKDNGIELSGKGGKPSMGKAVILKALEKCLKKYGASFNVQSGELESENDVSLTEPEDMLLRLVQKTFSGKGLKSWFDPEYIQNNEAHGRFNSCGASTGRLSSSKPNMQNIPRVGFGAQVRKALVAKPGCKVLKSDFSQLEFRVCLWAAGYDPNLADGAFEMLVERSEGQFEKAAVALQWKPRDVAKSMVHGGDYMEGLQIKTAKELSTPNALGDRREGALLVYDGRDLPEWRFRDGYVCFTGVNIAERLFGHKTREARARALKLQKVYLDAFPGIREFQQRVSKEIEFTNEVRLSSGHRVPLYGRTPEEDLKYAAALWGQGCGAIYIDEAMIRLDGLGRIANLQVHDELMFNDIPLEWKDETCLEYMHPMIQMSSILKGFSCPAAVKVGPSWGETKEIGVIR